MLQFYTDNYRLDRFVIDNKINSVLLLPMEIELPNEFDHKSIKSIIHNELSVTRAAGYDGGWESFQDNPFDLHLPYDFIPNNCNPNDVLFWQHQSHLLFINLHIFHAM